MKYKKQEQDKQVSHVRYESLRKRIEEGDHQYKKLKQSIYEED